MCALRAQVVRSPVSVEPGTSVRRAGCAWMEWQERRPWRRHTIAQLVGNLTVSTRIIVLNAARVPCVLCDRPASDLRIQVCERETRHFADPCSLCVYSAALLDLPATGVPVIPARTTQPILLECCIPRGAVPGNYSGLFAVSASTLGGVQQTLFQVPVRLEVWPITIPLTNASDAFTTMFSFNGADAPGRDGLTQWYPGKTAAELREAWFPFLSHYRVPADSSYSLGRPVTELEELVASGAKWVNLLDVGFTTIDALEPIIANVSTSLNDSATLYTYCCDEMNQDDNATLYETFGAVKRKWPWLKTVATLNWDEMPLDVPLDVWVPTAVNSFLCFAAHLTVSVSRGFFVGAGRDIHRRSGGICRLEKSKQKAAQPASFPASAAGARVLLVRLCVTLQLLSCAAASSSAYWRDVVMCRACCSPTAFATCCTFHSKHVCSSAHGRAFPLFLSLCRYWCINPSIPTYMNTFVE